MKDMKGHFDRLIITARNEELGVVNEQVIDPVRVSLYATLVMELIIPHLPVKGIHESNVNLSVLPPHKETLLRGTETLGVAFHLTDNFLALSRDNVPNLKVKHSR